MATIIVEKLCSCAKKRKSWSENIECESIEKAVEKAVNMCEQGNQRFCKKHKFEYEVVNNQQVHIKLKPFNEC